MYTLAIIAALTAIAAAWFFISSIFHKQVINTGSRLPSNANTTFARKEILAPAAASPPRIMPDNLPVPEAKSEGIDQKIALARKKASDAEKDYAQALADRLDVSILDFWIKGMRQALSELDQIVEKNWWTKALQVLDSINLKAESLHDGLVNLRAPLVRLEAGYVEVTKELAVLGPPCLEAVFFVPPLEWDPLLTRMIAGNGQAANRRLVQATERAVAAHDCIYSRDWSKADDHLALVKIWFKQIKIYLRAVRDLRTRLGTKEPNQSLASAYTRRLDTVLETNWLYVGAHACDLVWNNPSRRAPEMEERAKKQVGQAGFLLPQDALKVAFEEMAADLAAVEEAKEARLVVVQKDGHEPTAEEILDAWFVPAVPYNGPVCECCG